MLGISEYTVLIGWIRCDVSGRDLVWQWQICWGNATVKFNQHPTNNPSKKPTALLNSQAELAQFAAQLCWWRHAFDSVASAPLWRHREMELELRARNIEWDEANWMFREKILEKLFLFETTIRRNSIHRWVSEYFISSNDVTNGDGDGLVCYVLRKRSTSCTCRCLN